MNGNHGLQEMEFLGTSGWLFKEDIRSGGSFGATLITFTPSPLGERCLKSLIENYLLHDWNIFYFRIKPS